MDDGLKGEGPRTKFKDISSMSNLLYTGCLPLCFETLLSYIVALCLLRHMNSSRYDGSWLAWHPYLPSIPGFLGLSQVSASPPRIPELLQIIPGFSISETYSPIDPYT